MVPRPDDAVNAAGGRHAAGAPDPGFEALLERMRAAADPLADLAVARIVGKWAVPAVDVSAAALRAAHGAQFDRLAAASALFAGMPSNGALAAWAAGADDGATVEGALKAFVESACTLPPWADAAKLQRAEQLFLEHGALSCILLFCASLPECYVVPDLSLVLNASGQLEQRTDYRIRMTAAMIFPVMMPGGLTRPEGGGIAQVLKVRLIHATIRSLILRDTPEHASAALAAGATAAAAEPLPAAQAGARNMAESLFGLGWDLRAQGMPCNQADLAYTLLTFGYVFLRSLRRLGIGLPRADEVAFLHCWNVAGCVLGIEPALMAHTMAEAAALFRRLQAHGRAHPALPDPRPALGRALVATMAASIPFAVFKPFPRLMLRHLCGRRTARDIGLRGPVNGAAAVLFGLTMAVIRGIDTVVRQVRPGFSISRFLTRVLGYRLLTRVLMDQTRPLSLPEHLLDNVDATMQTWHDDPKAPRWLNRVEDRLTTPGRWQRAAPPADRRPAPG